MKFSKFEILLALSVFILVFIVAYLVLKPDTGKEENVFDDFLNQFDKKHENKYAAGSSGGKTGGFSSHIYVNPSVPRWSSSPQYAQLFKPVDNSYVSREKAKERRLAMKMLREDWGLSMEAINIAKEAYGNKRLLRAVKYYREGKYYNAARLFWKILKTSSNPLLKYSAAGYLYRLYLASGDKKMAGKLKEVLISLSMILGQKFGKGTIDFMKKIKGMGEYIKKLEAEANKRWRGKVDGVW